MLDYYGSIIQDNTQIDRDLIQYFRDYNKDHIKSLNKTVFSKTPFKIKTDFFVSRVQYQNRLFVQKKAGF